MSGFRHPWRALAAAMALALVACTAEADEADVRLAGPGDCVVVTTTVSPEKFVLLQELAQAYNALDPRVGDRCVYVEVNDRSNKASGLAAQLLADGWDEERDGPRPVLWSPAASTWGALVDQRLTDSSRPTILPADSPSFVTTPLVIAMPQPMAEALGWPDRAIGWADLRNLAASPEGWAGVGRPDWGAFRLGKTNPNLSTSGFSSLVAQNYAFSGTSTQLTSGDLSAPEVVAANRDIESAVVHYGETTLTFLQSWYNADRRGEALRYLSAMVVEEKSILDYNRGVPSGRAEPGAEPRAPRVPLVAVHPEEGTVLSDNPLYVLDAGWVTDEQREAGRRFVDFLLMPRNQRRALEYGFRPGNPEVPVGDPISAAHGLDPRRPTRLFEVPTPSVTTALLDTWAEQRKEARVLLLLDVSTSMGDDADGGEGRSRLDVAKQAVIEALDGFKDTSLLGVRAFPGDPNSEAPWVEPAPLLPLGDALGEVRRAVDELGPLPGGPLYATVGAAFEAMVADYDPDRINALVVLSNGRNEDDDPDDDVAQLEALLEQLRTAGTKGGSGGAVRVFTIAYGPGADLDVLRSIAEATHAKAYDAGTTTRLADVLAQVVGNF